VPWRNVFANAIESCHGLNDNAGAMKRICSLFMLALSCAGIHDVPGGDPGRITARPRAVGQQCRGGLRALGLDASRDAVLYVPAAVAEANRAAPLLVVLHGAGGSGERIVQRLGPFADAHGVILLAPSSRNVTWNSIRGQHGDDIGFMDRALNTVFGECVIEPSRIGVAGFSDGASYALTVGVANGDLFKEVMAFSPCILDEVVPHGRPRFFLSHGRQDDILPIADCGRPLAARLRASGYRVRFEEFDGRHEIPPAIAEEAFRWFVAGGK
jgi:phospholipase/carboxylesterase